jgi:hypothetical protein
MRSWVARTVPDHPRAGFGTEPAGVDDAGERRSAGGDVGVGGDVRRQGRVVVGAGDLDPAPLDALDLGVLAGHEAAVLQQLQRLVVALERLRDAHDVHRTDRRVGERTASGCVGLVARARDRVAVRAGAGVAEQLDQPASTSSETTPSQRSASWCTFHHSSPITSRAAARSAGGDAPR